MRYRLVAGVVIFSFLQSMALAIEGVAFKGSLEVNSVGAATTALPIIAPPAAGGVTPQLSLSYNSNAGNGHVGIGWSLTGLSSITRCPSNFQTDSRIIQVSLNSNDRLCLDGQRLIPKSGTYLSSSAEYRTQLEGFSKVITRMDSPDGIMWFQVWTKSGMILEYGYTANSRLEHPNMPATQPYAWYLSKASDRKGNYYQVTYSKVNGVSYPSLVQMYGAGIQAPSSYVEFSYLNPDVANGTRPDTLTLSPVMGQSSISMDKRLHGVESGAYVAGVKTPGRTYKLSYEPVTTTLKQSRLKNVQLCAETSTTDCQLLSLEHGKFGDDNDLLFSSQSSWLNNMGTAAGWTDTDKNPRQLVDVNADGILDLLGFSGWGVVVSYGTGSTFGPMQLVLSDFGTDVGATTNKSWSSGNQYPRLIGNVNGDGYPDIVAFGPNGVWLAKGNGTGFDVPVLQSSISYFTVSSTAWKNMSEYPRFLADINGDGRADIVGFNENGVYGSLASDSGFSSITNLSGSFKTAPTSFANMNTHPRFLVDVDRDGNLDIVGISESGISASFGNESGSFSAGAVSLFPDGLGFTPSTGWAAMDVKPRTFADVNNDGYLDMVGFNTNAVYVAYGLGRKFAAPVLKASFSETWTNTSTHPRRLADVNGDGFSDFVVFSDSGVKIAYGHASGFGALQAQIADFGVTGGWDDEKTKPRLLADVTGDGVLDILGFGATDVTVSKGVGSHWNQLTRVTDSLGNASEIDYTTLTDAAVYTKGTGATWPRLDVQFPMRVVSKVRASNGLGGMGELQYAYKGARMDNSRTPEGRGFLGFEEQTVKNLTTNRTVISQFSQAWPFTGVMTGATVKIGDGVLSQTTNLPGLKTCSAGYDYCGDVASTSVTVKDITKRYLPYIKTTQTLSYDYATALQLSSTSVTNTLNLYGNPITVKTDTAGDGRTFSTNEATTYLPSVTDWRLSLIDRKVVTKTQNDTDGIVANDSNVATVKYEYYPSGSANNDAGYLKAITVEPDDTTGKFKQVQGFEYDVFGNVKKTTLTAKVTAVGGTVADQIREKQIVFDASGRFPETQINDLGQTQTSTYHPFTGQQLTVTDANNVKVVNEYDWVGRLVQQQGPDDLDTTQSEAVVTTVTYGACAADCLPDTRYVMTASTPGRAEVTTYFDSLSREIGSRTTAMDGRYAYVEKTYNPDGTVSKQSRPYYQGDQKQWTYYEYDGLSRPTKITDPAGAVSTINYNGYEVVTLNANSQQRKERKNSAGQLVLVTDASNNTLRYDYDAVGNVARTVDAKSNEVKLTYDRLGRKTEMRDPDLGLWKYEYNGFGELEKKTDARNKTITHTYDVLGRLKTKTALGDMVVTNQYDDAAITNGVGRLFKTTTDTGYVRQISGYDVHGNQVTETATIAGADYALTTGYDTLGRLVSVQYPGGVGYRNVYNPTLGYLDKVTDYGNQNKTYWQAVATDAEGQVTEVLLGNGLTTQRSYKPTNGLLEAVRTGIKGPYGLEVTIQDDFYGHDMVGNLKLRADNLSLLNEHFDYDAINRLSSAEIDGMAAVSAQYDAIGNITYKSDAGTYAYPSSGVGSVRPHAVSGVSGGPVNATFDYDANGNMKTGNGRTYLDALGQQGWNSFNKPVTVVQGNVTESFLYDANFERVKRTTTIDGGTPSSIVYLNPRLDLGGTYEKEVKANGVVEQTYHLYAGRAPIGAIVVTGTTAPTTEVRYFHTDHLGSIVAITDGAGAQLEEFSFDAWGKRRDLMVTESGTTATISALTLPVVADDRYQLIKRDATTGNIVVHTNSLISTWPQARTAAVAAETQHKVTATVQTGLNPGNRRNFELSIENTALYASTNYRRYGVVMKGDTLYRRVCMGAAPCESRRMGTLLNNATYTVDLVTSAQTAQVNVRRSGVSYSDALSVGWTAGVSGMQKRVVSGVATRQYPLVIPVPIRWPDAPVTLTSLNQSQISVQSNAVMATTTRHGFTGHEMLDSLQLVHMNGRVYDPVLGRFLSADKIIDGVFDLQGYNRYSYVKNNPLAGTDPSGHCSTASYSWGDMEACISVSGTATFSVRDDTGQPTNTVAITSNIVNSQPVSQTTIYQNGYVETASYSGGSGSPVVVNSGYLAGGMNLDQYIAQQEYWSKMMSYYYAVVSLSGNCGINGCKPVECGGEGLAAVCGYGGNPAQEIAIDALKDRKLTWLEANAIWRANTDPFFELTVDASLLTIKQGGLFNSRGVAGGRVPYSDADDWAVHGSVTLYRDQSGNISILPGKYDFDMQGSFWDRPIRNFETYGGFWAGSILGTNVGTDFLINYSGSPSVVK